jgi:hypothetical protein
VGATYTVLECKQLGQNTIQERDFTRRTIHARVEFVARVHHIFDFGEHKRMLANLSKLHDSVVQPLDASLFPVTK